jgi:hypothetical protein
MEPFWYFITRAASTLIPLLLLAYGAGLWTGWIKWHTWKREYQAVETDYHKLHDIHDVARATIPELEQRREALSGEIQGLEDLLGQYKDANERFEAESHRLNQSLRATKRNYEALEDIWRVKLATAELRIQKLEALLPRESTPAGMAAHAPSDPIAPESMEGQADQDGHRLIPFPASGAETAAAAGETAPPAKVPAAAASGKTSRRIKGRRAV